MVQEIQAWVTVVANVVMALAAVGALQQVFLLKKDIHDRNERAANEKALEAVAEYANFAKLSEDFWAALKKVSLPLYRGPVSDFTPSSVQEEWRNGPGAARRDLTEWIPALNQLDKLAGSLVTGVGSERTAFAMIGRSFCTNVHHYYDLISHYRTSRSQPHFASIVALYQLWAPRISEPELLEERRIRGSSASEMHPDSQVVTTPN